MGSGYEGAMKREDNPSAYTKLARRRTHCSRCPLHCGRRATHGSRKPCYKNHR